MKLGMHLWRKIKNILQLRIGRKEERERERGEDIKNSLFK